MACVLWFQWKMRNALFLPFMPIQVGRYIGSCSVKRAYEILAEAGTVLLEPGALPLSNCCADIVDKYGVYWYLSV